jgi:hypothetical protein
MNRRRILLAVMAIVLGALVSSIWYVCTKGFTRSWRRLIAEEFEKRGFEISLHKLALDPFRGLVAQEVKLLDVNDRRRVLATVDEMELGVNWAGAFHGRNVIDSIDLIDATLSLPLDTSRPGAGTFEISKLNARVFFPPQQIYVQRAQAGVLGLQVYASGRLINPQAYHGSEDEAALAKRLTAIVDLLHTVRFRGAAPVLALEFSGDLEKPEEIALDGRFYSEGVKQKNYTMSQIVAQASYRNGTLELHKLSAADGKGELRASATWQPKTGKIVARLQSGMAAQDFWRAYVSETLPVPLSLTAAPKLNLTVEGAFARRYDWSVFGHVELERFGFRGVQFRSMSGDVSWSGGRWSLRDFRLQHQSGELRGDTIVVPGDFRARLNGSVNPRVLAPLLHEGLSEWLGRFEFVDSPAIELELQGAAPTLDTCTATGKIHFDRALYDGAPAEHFTTEVRYAARTVSLYPFRAPDDSSDAELIFDFRTGEVRMEKKAAETD